MMKYVGDTDNVVWRLNSDENFFWKESNNLESSAEKKRLTVDKKGVKTQ